MFETMLIVDDYQLEREMLMDMMQDSFMILEAENGKECLEVVESCQGHIDVVLLDLMMPVLDGFGVLEKRKELEYFRNIPVIVLTSSGAVEDQIRAFNLGANDFISKPIITDIAILRINNVLASNRRLKSILKDSEELKARSELDQMTGLYNKATAEQIIDQMLQQNPKEQHGLMIIDIDNFKAVNDLEGHQVGDHTIKIIADLISSHFRKSDIVGRIGGDEFVVCMSNIPSETIARNKAKDIVRIMRFKPNMSIPANVSLSIGLAFSDRTLTDYQALFQKADAALYYSKKNGKARYTEYGKEDSVTTAGDKSLVVLCSRSRNVCSMVESIFDDTVLLKDAVNIQEACNMFKENPGKVKLAYIDISEETDLGVLMIQQLEECREADGIPCIFVCQEGSIQQYRSALTSSRAVDVLTAPLEIEQLKRRTAKQM